MSKHDSERKHSKHQAITIGNCIFCEKGCEESRLHQVPNIDADTSICAMVTKLQDTHLPAKIVMLTILLQEKQSTT